MMQSITSKRSSANAISSDISVQKRTSSKIQDTDLENPSFGSSFSDHMFSMEYHDGKWQEPAIIPYEDISCSPATIVFHYGQTVFEGLKAFRGNDGKIRIFRPRDHFERLNRSCERMCIPPIDPDFLVTALHKLVTIDKDWVPVKQGNALYVRPLIIATEPALGVRPSETYRLLIMTSPVGAYYKEGINPVSLTTSDEYIRAVKGGSGFAKTACNYGPSLLPAQQAQDKGFTQVLWLDACEHRYIEEVGTMNIFFKIDGTLVTPALNGSILGGVTRDSVLHLAEKKDIIIEERPVSIDELFEAHRNDSLEEVFGTGTAAVISPVGSIHHKGKTIITDEENIGPLAESLYHTITEIQYGVRNDPFDWTYPVD